LLATFPADVGRIRQLIRKHDIDLVVVNGLVNPHGAIAARLEGKAVVWQILDTRVSMAVRRALMPLVNWLADSVVFWGSGLVSSHPGAERLSDRLVVVMPPVDTAVFQRDPLKRLEARRILGFGDGDLVVGNIGNINLQKGHMNFVRAAAVLRRLHPRVKFLILGAAHPPHLSYSRSVLTLAESLGLHVGSDLIVCDPHNQVALLAQAMDIFWLPSEPLSEGIPTVVPEAMALGLPVVAADVGAVREVVRDGVSGYVVAPRDAEAFAAKTDAILKSPDLKLRLTTEARRQVTARHALDVCADTQIIAFNTAIAHAARRYAKGHNKPRT
jgi:glycosyltransferase involved in cell wall biosynthesis